MQMLIKIIIESFAATTVAILFLMLLAAMIDSITKGPGEMRVPKYYVGATVEIRHGIYGVKYEVIAVHIKKSATGGEVITYDLINHADDTGHGWCSNVFEESLITG
jgi:hypothetical protein